MSNMKAVTVREVQHRLAAILERVEQGERVTITRRGQAVATLVPAGRRGKIRWPDFKARMERIFPPGPPPGEPASVLIRAAREERI